MKIIMCCKGCDKRYVGCHSECVTYLQQKKERDEEQESLKKAKSKDFEYYSFKAEKIIRETHK